MDVQGQLAQAQQLIKDKQYEEAKAILRGLPENETAQQWLAKLENMTDEETQTKLKQAQALIKQKQFAEARAILTGIADHPTAQQWLEQIDKLAAGESPGGASPVEVGGTPASQPGGGAEIDRLRAESADAGDSTLDEVRDRAKDALERANIDLALAQRVLIIAAVSGLLAALLDTILGMPGALVFTFGGFVAVINGPIYARLMQKISLPAWIMSAAAGLVTTFVWWLVLAIILGDADGSSSHDVFRFWFDEHTNILKALVSGPIMGLMGLGWYWLVPRLPHDVASLRALVPGRGGD